MNVDITTNTEELMNIEVGGRVDSSCAAEFEESLLQKIDERNPAANVILDLAGLTYISSAGLRGLLKAQKKAGAKMSIINVTDEVYEIFKMTGFTRILSIQGR